MTKNKHLYLKNESKRNDGFKKTRNVQSDSKSEEEIELSKLPTPRHQARLKRALSSFYTDRKARNERRTIEVPSTIELLKIQFYDVFNNDLRNKFSEKYGLQVSSYENFNKTVLFEIAETSRFKTFVKHLELFFQSPNNKTYHGKEYNLIALIHNFSFLSSRRRILSYKGNLLSFGLITPQTEAANSIYKSFTKYLKSNDIKFYRTSFTSEFIEIENLTREQVEEVVNNFDIIKEVSSSRTERRRPGQYGEERREYGFKITIPENIPIVGIIDTGVSKIDPLLPCLSGIEYDLTGTGAFWDESGHGTAIASLVAFGPDFISEIKKSYRAKARIAVIKAIQKDTDSLNIIRLIDTIVDAKIKHNIRIYNLSINDPLPKEYNSSFSNFAYLLDRIAFEHYILIFISVGNISANRLKELIHKEPHPSHAYPNIFYSLEDGSEIHSCETTNITEPSESLNNISVGALAGNLEGTLNSDITPSEELPAYYTRKFHYDYEQTINKTKFIGSQKNKHLNKPDLVFEAGDLFKYSSGMEIIQSPNPASGQRFFSRNCGTSLSTPLICSLAAEIAGQYPGLRTQTIKSLLINSASSPCGNNPITFRDTSSKLLRKLIGFGKPNQDGLIFNDDNSVTFVIESEIKLDEFQTVIISLPKYINKSGNKLNFTGSLSYSFLPIKENHLGYLPLQITFGIFKPIHADKIAGEPTQDYQIKNGLSWSDDFFGVEKRLFSNVQKIGVNIDGKTIEELGNKVSLAIKCTGKKDIPYEDRSHLTRTKHKFSLVLTITELPTSRAKNRLYNDIVALNTVQAIAELETDITLEAEAE